MLTESERRRLADIESSLRDADPAFVERMAQGWHQRSRRRKLASRLGTVAALGMASLGIGLAHLNLVVLSVAAIAVALVGLGVTAFLDD